MNDIILRRYVPRDRDAFRSLNLAWIERYFAVEHKDLEVLGDPETHIRAKGGAILIAELADGRIAGCCALLPIAGGFEIGKMAVAEEHQGKGIGKRILRYAVEEARRAGARRIYLESNTSLPNAIHIYEEAGFRHLPAERVAPSPYARSNVHMELLLEQGAKSGQPDEPAPH